jgi:oxaloacetate decarboxylase alpha subunit
MLSNLISQLKEAKAEDKYYAVLDEIPKVRKEFGYPPLVTPTSQIVGTQAVMNVLAGQRYKMVSKESKALIRGESGQLPAPVDPEVQKMVIGDAEVITCRPADLLKPEFDNMKEEIGELARSEEDVLSYALFPQVAKAFFERRLAKEKGPEEEDELIAVMTAVLQAHMEAEKESHPLIRSVGGSYRVLADITVGNSTARDVKRQQLFHRNGVIR